MHALPSAEMYERSYMHRDVVTHAVVAAEVDFLITGSADGHIKFWKKRATGIEFAKHFRAHLGPVKGEELAWTMDVPGRGCEHFRCFAYIGFPTSACILT